MGTFYVIIINLLYTLLARLDLGTPERLERYISALSGDIERRPLAEQIVDQLLAQDESRYRLYDEIKAAKDRAPWKEQERIVGPEALEAIGLFLSKWIELERIVRRIVTQRSGQETVALPTSRTLGLLEVSDAWTRSEIENIRRLRNNLVHGIEIPETPVLVDAARRLEPILVALKKALGINQGQAGTLDN